VGVQYDRFIHFGSAFFGILVVFIFYILIQTQLKKKAIKKTIAITFSFAVILIGLFVWEVYQYTVDQVFGSKLFYDAMQDIAVDVREDILYGLLGLFAGVVYISYSFRSFLPHITR
jgi:hypothetical protein